MKKIDEVELHDESLAKDNNNNNTRTLRFEAFEE